MTEISLAAEPRQGTGKGVARKLRRAGLVPGVVYGVGEPLPIQFDGHTASLLVHRLHGSERLIALKLAAGERRVLLKDVQMTPVGERLLHIDFHEVDVTKTVQVSVDVHPDGTSAGEREGGVMQQTTYNIVVECLPTAIPDQVTVDVSALNIGDSLHVSDVSLPTGVTAVTPEEETLFTVTLPRAATAEEEEGEEALAEGEAGAAPEGEEAGEGAAEEAE